MSAFTDSLQLLKMDIGENPNIWGDTLNDQFIELADEAVAGARTIDLSGLNSYALNDNPGVSNESRVAFLILDGFPTSGITVTVPMRQKLYAVVNSTPKDITFTPQGGIGVTIVNNTNRWITIDSTLNQAFLLQAAATVDAAATPMQSTLGTIQNSGGATATVYWVQEGSQFAIGWEDITATVTATTFVITGNFPDAPQRAGSYILWVQEDSSFLEAYAVFTSGQIEFFPVSTNLIVDLWTSGSVRQIQQTWLNLNQAPN